MFPGKRLIQLLLLALMVIALVISCSAPAASFTGDASENKPAPSRVEIVVLEYHHLITSPDVNYVDAEPRDLYYELHFQLHNVEIGTTLHDVGINITDINDMPINPDTGELCPSCWLWPSPTSFGDNWLYWYIGDLEGSEEFWDWAHLFWGDEQRTYRESLGFTAEREYQPKYIQSTEDTVIQTVTLKINPIEKDEWLHAGISYEQALINAEILDYTHKEDVIVLHSNEIEWMITPPLEDSYVFQATFKLSRKPGVEGMIEVIPWCRADLRKVRFEYFPAASEAAALLEDGIVKVTTSDVVDWSIMYESPSKTVFFSSREGMIVNAVIDMKPDALNLRSNARWVTAYIELPKGYDVKNIDVSTILLNNIIPAEPHPIKIGDYDADGIPDLMVKFDKSAVSSLIKPGEKAVTFMISGEVNGVSFIGFDVVKVVGKNS